MRPFCLQIESTNACNLRCVMCPRQAMTRPVGFMDLRLFRKIIDETVPLDHVWLHHFGEPLLHPRIEEMIAYAKEANIRQVGISTNATLLTSDRWDALIESGLDHLIISVDGIREAYDRLRVGGNWDEIYRNITGFMEARGLGKPKTWIQIIDMPGVDISGALDFWGPVAEELSIDRIDVKKFDTWANQVEAIRRIRSKETVSPREPCPFLWAVMVVCWDGICVPCCRDYDAKVKLGNANGEGMLGIFNGPLYGELRRAQNEGDFDNPLCRDCVEWAEAKGIETKYAE